MLLLVFHILAAVTSWLDVELKNPGNDAFYLFVFVWREQREDFYLNQLLLLATICSSLSQTEMTPTGSRELSVPLTLPLGITGL